MPTLYMLPYNRCLFALRVWSWDHQIVILSSGYFCTPKNHSAISHRITLPYLVAKWLQMWQNMPLCSLGILYACNYIRFINSILEQEKRKVIVHKYNGVQLNVLGSDPSKQWVSDISRYIYKTDENLKSALIPYIRIKSGKNVQDSTQIIQQRAKTQQSDVLCVFCSLIFSQYDREMRLKTMKVHEFYEQMKFCAPGDTWSAHMEYHCEKIS